jgi:DNA polymerase III subunit delta
MQKNYQQILEDFKKKKFTPLYWLEGEESFFIDLVSDYAEQNILDESEKAFNQLVIYGRDVTAKSIGEQARRFPMMGTHQLVLVKEAQDVKNWDDFISYAEKPLASTILIICHKYKTLDKRTKLSKQLNEVAVVFNSKKLYDNQLPEWITDWVTQRRRVIKQKAAMLLAEFLGNNLSRINNELEKLFINVREGEEVTAELIEKNIGISKEYNSFELTKALGERNNLKANRIIHYMAENPKNNNIIMVIGSVFNFFSKVYLVQNSRAENEQAIAAEAGVSSFYLKEYKEAASRYSRKQLENIFSVIHQYDLYAKGIDAAYAAEGEFLKEMIFKILHEVEPIEAV